MPDGWTKADINPAETSAIYDTLLDEWTLNATIAEMHLDDLRDGGLLDQFGGGSAQPTEAAAQYAWRKAASFAMDHAADLIDLRVQNIFRTPPVRDYADSPHAAAIDEFLADVDGAGTDMTAFMRQNLPLHYINGTDFVVSKKRPEEGVEVTNLAQERELGLGAYVQAFGPRSRVDWSVTSAGEFLWARYALGIAPSTDEMGTDGGEEEWLTVLPDKWRLYRKGEKETGVFEGKHSLEMCPIVPFYFKESNIDGYRRVPLSLLTRISPVARYLINLLSQIQIDILRNICFMAATGVEAEKIPTAISPMGCWALPDGATLTMLTGDVAHVIQKTDFAQMLMQVILRLGKVQDSSGEAKAKATSGIQVAVERTDLDNEMRATAHQLGEVETQIVRMAISRQLGKPVTTEELAYNVKYCTRYVLSDVTALLANVKEFFGIAGMAQNLPVFARAFLERLADAVAAAGDKTHEEILAELKAAEDFDPMGPSPAVPEDQTEDTSGGLDEVDDEDELDDEAE